METIEEVRRKMAEDVTKLIAFLQDHEELFDDLKTNYSLDETLTQLREFCYD